MLLRSSIAPARALASGGAAELLVGMGGGLVGGLTAMPGALPTIWCDLRGMTKTQQRGLVQPFILVMQMFALALMLANNGLASGFLIELTFSLPALAVGTALGMILFERINERLFRRAVLAVLFLSGVGLVI
jgi:uncharacterized membrane protein YfcA